MKNLIPMIIGLVFLSLSCTKDKAILLDCPNIASATIIPEGSESSTCVFSRVYRYKGEIYSVGYCCFCNMIYMAFDCNGEPLCPFDQNCMEDFDAKAKYLFRVENL